MRLVVFLLIISFFIGCTAQKNEFEEGYIYGSIESDITNSALLVAYMKLGELTGESKKAAWVTIDTTLIRYIDRNIPTYPKDHIFHKLENLGSVNRSLAIGGIIAYRLEDGHTSVDPEIEELIKTLLPK